MARKREMTYNDIMRNAEKMRRMAELKRERMVHIMAGTMDDKTAAALGDLSDPELSRVAVLMFGHAGEFAAQVKAENETRRKARQAAN